MANSDSIPLRVAFDIGGTFTDVIISVAGRALQRFKVLSLPERIGADIRACIEQVAAQTDNTEVDTIVHGTTIATNTVLEKSGPRTGLITTRGFRDELEIRRLARPGVYDVNWSRTEPLIPRRLRLEVTGRLDLNGNELEPLDLEGLRSAFHKLKEEQVEALAIAFLHSYVEPGHERTALEIAREILPHAAICTSSEVLAEVREYERTSTAALNAYLMPVVAGYLDHLEQQLGGFDRPIHVMQSNGGIMSARRSRSRPVNMIESGPAAGALAASSLARALGLSQVVAFDMGGTTAKACLIEDGQAVETTEGEVGAGINLTSRLSKGAGYAIRVPAYDLAEVGAGGGSIAWVDSGGALRVGPKSAGAEPGPAAYGRGGTSPTISDANVLLGYINPKAIAGGTVPIDLDAAKAAIRPLCESLTLGETETALGIHQVGNATMARAIRAVTTERGRDPREFEMIAFGGSGAIHAASLAESLGIQRLRVPLHPGLFSAVGLLLADLRYDFVQSVPAALDSIAPEEFMRHFEQLAERALEDLADDHREVQTIKQIDLHYARQSSELTLDFPNVANADIHSQLEQAFHREHHKTYGYRRDGDKISVLSLRLRLTATAQSTDLQEIASAFHSEQKASELGRRKLFFGATYGTCDAPVLNRAALSSTPRAGPLIIEEFDSTVVVPPNWSAKLDKLANIQLETASPEAESQND